MRSVTLPLALATVLGAAGCSDPELERRVAQLETEVEQMKKGGAPVAAAAPGAANAQAKPMQPAAANDPRNEAAIALFREANQLIASNDYEQAKAKLTELQTNYGDTPAGKSGQKVMAEIGIIGNPAPALAVDKWYQGQTTIDPANATLLVFWEVWCPHCKREVPKLEGTHNTWGPKGLKVIGLTKQTRDITDEQVATFIKENGVTYPTAREGGSMSSAFSVSGIPAAAVVKGGKIVWRGHPGRITDDMLKEWTGT